MNMTLLKHTLRFDYNYCKYKSKPVILDERGYCDEGYCSKKPFQNKCPMATLKFGNPP